MSNQDLTPIRFPSRFDWLDSETNETKDFPDGPQIIDNYVRLGLVVVDYSRHKAGTDAFDWVEN